VKSAGFEYVSFAGLGKYGVGSSWYIKMCETFWPYERLLDSQGKYASRS
jgi:hypothetical protein